MQSGKFCPVCKRKNLIEAMHCDYCQTPLESGSQDADTTLQVAGVQPDLLMKPAQHLPLLAQLPVNALVLFVMDNEEPVVIKDCVKVVLGRHISPSSIPVADLRPYDAAGLGVSRQHAIVVNMLDSYTIQDLDSTNGTWLNGLRLEPGKEYPFASGAQVRLGRLTLYAYFRLHTATEDILLLYEAARGSTLLRPALTPSYLAEVVHPFLQALADVQHLLDDAQGQPHSHVYVNTISASRHHSPIGISLTGASAAVRVATEWVKTWRKENAGLWEAQNPFGNGGRDVGDRGADSAAIGAHAAGEPAGKTGPLSLLIDESQAPGAHAAPLPVDLQAAIENLAGIVLGQLLPDVSEPDRTRHAAALVPPLRVLATSKLQVYVGDPGQGGA